MKGRDYPFSPSHGSTLRLTSVKSLLSKAHLCDKPAHSTPNFTLSRYNSFTRLDLLPSEDEVIEAASFGAAKSALNRDFGPQGAAVSPRAGPLRPLRVEIPLQTSRHIHRSGSPAAVFNDGSAAVFEKCIICMDRPGDRTLCPCKHTNICADCSERLHACPLCRSRITAVVSRY